MQVFVGMTGDSYLAQLGRVAELAMAAGLANLSPAVPFNELDDREPSCHEP